MQEKLSEVEKEELARILDLPSANRFPTENDILFLKEHIGYLSADQIKQFNLDVFVSTKDPEVKLGHTLKSKPVKVVVAAKKAKALPRGKQVAKKMKKVKVDKKPAFKLVKKAKKKAK